jgi:hypothetical protein
MKAASGIAAVVLILAVLTPGQAGAFPQTRDGWLVGFGIGGGSAGVSGDDNREGGTAGSFRVGYAFQPEVSLELNSTGWSKSESGTTVTFTVTGVALNYYPGAQGFVLRGGAGLGSASATEKSGSTTFSASESGLGVLLGAGYEFRVRRTFAIGPQIDFGYLNLEDGSVNYVNGCLGLHWYFIPKQ